MTDSEGKKPKKVRMRLNDAHDIRRGMTRILLMSLNGELSFADGSRAVLMLDKIRSAYQDDVLEAQLQRLEAHQSEADR